MRLPIVIATAAALSLSPVWAQSLIPPPPTPGIAVPDWAIPQSPGHVQVPPPLDFHRPSRTYDRPVGQFENSTDVGGALVAGTASYDPSSRQYTITAAGYNIWYQRDEFHFLWRKMSGDVSLAASVIWPNINDFHDRKVALVIRDGLEDDAREIVAAQHGNGMVHIAWRAEKAGQMTDISYRAARQPILGTSEQGLPALHASRIGIEKKGDQFQLWVSWQGEPIHPEGSPVTFKTNGPFYVGIGFTSHLPANLLTAKVADVVLENRSDRIR